MVAKRERMPGAARGKIDLSKLVEAAVKEGVRAIAVEHPRFKGQEDRLSGYIDEEKLRGYVQEKLGAVEDSGAGPEFYKNLYNNLASLVASGKLFDGNGREFVLRESLEKQSGRLFGGGVAREIRRGEEYLDGVLDSFRELYYLLSKGDYSQRMPELTQAITTVYDMGFADEALNVLYQRGLMNKERYRVLKNATFLKARQSVENTEKQLEKLVLPSQALAASIFGILGIATLFTTNKITGNIIGVSASSSWKIPVIVLGILFLIFGAWVLFFKKIKSKK